MEVAMLLTVVMPVYNEVDSIDEIVGAVLRESTSKELIIVDDGSEDGTRDKLVALEDNPSIRVILHRQNQGKSAALRTGIAKAKGDIVIIQDADLEYDPEDYTRLIRPIVEEKANVVFGTRFAGGQSHRVLYFWHSLGNRGLTLLSNMLTDLNLTDMETCYKVFRREIIQAIPIEEDRFGFEPEITAKVAKKGCRIYEVGISYHGRTYNEGKKTTWRDGLSAVWCILKYNLFA